MGKSEADKGVRQAGVVEQREQDGLMNRVGQEVRSLDRSIDGGFSYSVFLFEQFKRTATAALDTRRIAVVGNPLVLTGW